jgi:hypothetical protein
MVAFKNRFGWSVSRERMFDECRRKYFFHYYFSWGGWQRSAPLVAREAFKLKRLVPPALWRGQLVHYVVSKILQSMKVKGRIPKKSDVLDYALERFEAQLDFSKRKLYLTEPKKKGDRINIDWLALFEHEYDRPLEADRLDVIKRECLDGIEGFFSSPLLPTLAETDPEGWTIEDLDHAEFSQVVEFDRVTVFVKTDLLFRDNDGLFNIVDWKTNRPGAKNLDATAEMNRTQLGIYGYYAVTALGEELERLRLLEVNLLDKGSVKESSVGETDIEHFRTHINAGIGKLSQVLEGGDTERNEPLPPRHFPPIDNGRCYSCNFYRVCKMEDSPVRLID